MVDMGTIGWVTASGAAQDGSTYQASMDRVVHVSASGSLDYAFGLNGVKSFATQDGLRCRDYSRSRSR